MWSKIKQWVSDYLGWRRAAMELEADLIAARVQIGRERRRAEAISSVLRRQAAEHEAALEAMRQRVTRAKAEVLRLVDAVKEAEEAGFTGEAIADLTRAAVEAKSSRSGARFPLRVVRKEVV